MNRDIYETVDDISNLMHLNEEDTNLVDQAAEYALKYRGIFDLFELYRDEPDTEEREAIMFDIKEMLTDIESSEWLDADLGEFTEENVQNLIAQVAAQEGVDISKVKLIPEDRIKLSKDDNVHRFYTPPISDIRLEVSFKDKRHTIRDE